LIVLPSKAKVIRKRSNQCQEDLLPVFHTLWRQFQLQVLPVFGANHDPLRAELYTVHHTFDMPNWATAVAASSEHVKLGPFLVYERLSPEKGNKAIVMGVCGSIDNTNG
jgi:hypothetical protein